MALEPNINVIITNKTQNIQKVCYFKQKGYLIKALIWLLNKNLPMLYKPHCEEIVWVLVKFYALWYKAPQLIIEKCNKHPTTPYYQFQLIPTYKRSHIWKTKSTCKSHREGKATNVLLFHVLCTTPPRESWLMVPFEGICLNENKIYAIILLICKMHIIIQFQKIYQFW